MLLIYTCVCGNKLNTDIAQLLSQRTCRSCGRAWVDAQRQEITPKILGGELSIKPKGERTEKGDEVRATVLPIDQANQIDQTYKKQIALNKIKQILEKADVEQ